MTEFGTEVRTARQNKNLSQEELGELVGADLSTINRIETGKTKNPRVRDAIERVLEIGRYAPAPEPPPGPAADPEPGPRWDPRLSEMSFADLIHAASFRYHELDQSHARLEQALRSAGLHEELRRLSSTSSPPGRRSPADPPEGSIPYGLPPGTRSGDTGEPAG